ncbi:MAG: abortive infection family protein [Holophagales bacterium]|jgi:hypothetical protein|nr:abortive infection family protein [Holophagales bacterium]
MANLSFHEEDAFEHLFGMKSGYLPYFSDRTFALFVRKTIGIDIYGGAGYTTHCSKANKLRQIWRMEPDNVVGKLLDALLTYFEENTSRANKNLTDSEKMHIQELRLVCQRLIGNAPVLELPTVKEETLSALLEDINRSLAANQPTLVLDRLHTFSTKLLRCMCVDNGINVKDDTGKHLPLHSLAGMLKKIYAQKAIFQSRFTLLAIQNSVSLFESYNEIRNNRSFAHDNEILNNIEAAFAVRIMADFITFIDKIAGYAKQEKQTIEIGDDGELSF